VNPKLLVGKRRRGGHLVPVALGQLGVPPTGAGAHRGVGGRRRGLDVGVALAHRDCRQSAAPGVLRRKGGRRGGDWDVGSGVRDEAPEQAAGAAAGEQVAAQQRQANGRRLRRVHPQDAGPRGRPVGGRLRGRHVVAAAGPGAGEGLLQLGPSAPELEAQEAAGGPRRGPLPRVDAGVLLSPRRPTLRPPLLTLHGSSMTAIAFTVRTCSMLRKAYEPLTSRSRALLMTI